MFKRFRQVLVAFAATTAVAATTVAVAGPASADPGVTCAAPSISGTVMPGWYGSTTNQVYVSAQGSTSANCTTPFFNYKYKLNFYPASVIAHATPTSADEVQSTSLTWTGAGTSIAFPQADFGRTAFGYHGTYVSISSYAKSPIAQTWPTEPTNVDWYFLPSYGSYNTATMAQDEPPNYCQVATSYTKGGC